jgi:hypothetical protein
LFGLGDYSGGGIVSFVVVIGTETYLIKPKPIKTGTTSRTNLTRNNTDKKKDLLSHRLIQIIKNGIWKQWKKNSYFLLLSARCF